MSFSLQVSKHVIQENLAFSKSVVCSPTSIDAILRMLAVGAENSTLAQLLQLLGHGDLRELNLAAAKLADILKSAYKKGILEISYVNALWLDQRLTLKADFEKVLNDVHNAQVRAVDFVNQADQVVKEANTWAEKETRGLIKQIFSSNDINDKTMLLLANALYFKGTWEKSFEPKYTRNSGFSLLDGTNVQVPFMNQSDYKYDYGMLKECQVIRLPYKTGKSSKRHCFWGDYFRAPTKTFSMYIFLPNEKDGLTNLMESINIHKNMFKDQIKLKNVTVTTLSVPQFKIESHNVSLMETMKQLGLVLPFEESCKDFSGMADMREPVYVSNVVQKCCVEVNEQGTEAAAVTALGMMIGCGPSDKVPPPEIKFVADHPFMFMIREDASGAILFIGTMLDPSP